MLETYIDRTVHLHVKDVRDRIADVAQCGPMPFAFAVIEGAFTVPGDGGIDYVRIFDILKGHGIKAGSSSRPSRTPSPRTRSCTATLGREYIRNVTGW